jgi:hypothetical protein
VISVRKQGAVCICRVALAASLGAGLVVAVVKWAAADPLRSCHGVFVVRSFTVRTSPYAEPGLVSHRVACVCGGAAVGLHVYVLLSLP